MKKKAFGEAMTFRDKYLAVTIALLFFAFSANAQWTDPNPGAYGNKQKGIAISRFLGIPTGNGSPSLPNTVDSTLKRAGTYFDSTAGVFYVYNPKTATWGSISGGGSTPTLQQVTTAGNVTTDSITTGKIIVKSDVKGFLNTTQEWQRANGKVRMSFGDVSNLDSAVALKIIGTHGISEGVEFAMVQDEGGPNLRNYGGYFFITPTTSNLEWWSRTNDVDNKRLTIENVTGQVIAENNFQAKGTSLFGDDLTVWNDRDATTKILIRNQSAGTGASAQLSFMGDGATTSLARYGSNVGAYKILQGNDFHIYNPTVGNINILNDWSGGQIRFAAKGASTPDMALGVDSTVKIFGSLNVTGLHSQSAASDSMVVVNSTGGFGYRTIPSASGSGWSLTGNSGTTAGTNFIGTTDNNGFKIKANNIQSGYIDLVNFNTSFGHQSLISQTTAQYNTAIGGGAMQRTTSGNYNTAVGYTSLDSNTTGNNNVAIGINAMKSNTTGAANTAVGLGSLNNNKTGDGNTAIGYYARVASDSTSNATAIGDGAIGSYGDLALSPSVVRIKAPGMASTSGYVLTDNGSGVFTPQPAGGGSDSAIIAGAHITKTVVGTNIILDAVPSSLTFLQPFQHNTAGDSIWMPAASATDSGYVGIGAQTFAGDKTFLGNVGIGMTANAGYKLQIQDVNTIVGLIVPNDITKNQYFGIGDVFGANNSTGIIANDSLQVMTIQANNGIGLSNNVNISGNVGIGVAPSTYKLDVFGDVSLGSNALSYTGLITTDLANGAAKLGDWANNINNTNLVVDDVAQTISLKSNNGVSITGDMSVSGGLSLGYVAKTSTYTATASDYTINCTSGTFTVNLLTAVGNTGKVLIIKNSGAGAITVDGNASETIDGSTTYSLPTQYKQVTIQSNGANWIIIGNN